MGESTAPLSSETTTRAHFPTWQPCPSHPYAEMPAIVGKQETLLVIH